MMEGVNATMIYYKNFCKCHVVPLYNNNNNNIEKNKQIKKSTCSWYYLHKTQNWVDPIYDYY
jgi:hypothetical protein